MKLIINADDLGLSKSITDGIIVGILGGYITSTTIMSNMDYAECAIKQAIKNNTSCIGLHINLTVGRPIIKNSNLTDSNGIFLYNKNQIEKIKEYGNDKIKIDHLDFHHHLLSNDIIKKAALDIAKDLNIPVRNQNITNYKCPDISYKDFTINNVNIDNLKQMISKYNNKDIVVEIMTHPGYVDEYTKSIISYLGRENELNVLKEDNQLVCLMILN